MNKSAVPRKSRKKLPHISKLIQELRINQNWTQTVAADKVGISCATLARIEQSHLSLSAKTLEKILAFYDKTLSAIDIEQSLRGF